MLWKTPIQSLAGETVPQVNTRIVEYQQRKELGDLVRKLDTVRSASITVSLSSHLAFYFP